MFDQTADLYDLFYDPIKDYPAEVDALLASIRRWNPQARSLLDIGCGTGKHLELLGRQFGVVGVDIEPGMVEVARRRNPGVAIEVGDVLTLALGRPFDVVTFLFSGIAYVRTADRLSDAIGGIGAHLAPGGIAIIDGWLRPDAVDPSLLLNVETVKRDGLAGARVTRHEIEGPLSRLHIEYVFTDRSTFRRASEVHELGLLPRSDYERGFAAAGLEICEICEEIPGRDRFIVRAPAALA